MGDLFSDMKRIMKEEASGETAHFMYGQHDVVNSPAHYTDGGIETIDYIEAKLTDEQFVGYCLGNAMKYISRAGKKGDRVTDLKKAVWYLNRAIAD